MVRAPKARVRGERSEARGEIAARGGPSRPVIGVCGCKAPATRTATVSGRTEVYCEECFGWLLYGKERTRGQVARSEVRDGDGELARTEVRGEIAPPPAPEPEHPAVAIARQHCADRAADRAAARQRRAVARSGATTAYTASGSTIPKQTAPDLAGVGDNQIVDPGASSPAGGAFYGVPPTSKSAVDLWMERWGTPGAAIRTLLHLPRPKKRHRGYGHY